eukprot:Opistho-1_new@4483
MEGSSATRDPPDGLTTLERLATVATTHTRSDSGVDGKSHFGIDDPAGKSVVHSNATTGPTSAPAQMTASATAPPCEGVAQGVAQATASAPPPLVKAELQGLPHEAHAPYIARPPPGPFTYSVYDGSKSKANGGSCAPSAPDLSDEHLRGIDDGDVNSKIRKVSHSVVERRRRDKINEKICELKSMVPTCVGHDNLQKVIVLERVVEYIDAISEENAALRRENLALRGNCTDLHRKLESLEQHYSHQKGFYYMAPYSAPSSGHGHFAPSPGSMHSDAASQRHVVMPQYSTSSAPLPFAMQQVPASAHAFAQQQQQAFARAAYESAQGGAWCAAASNSGGRPLPQ